MVMMRLKLRSLGFHEGNITVLAIQTCMVKPIRFLSRNQRVPSSSLITAIGKKSTVKDLNKLEFPNFFEKVRSLVVGGAKQRVIPIPSK